MRLARLLAHACGLPHLVAEVIELGSADVADARHLDLLDPRRVDGERALDEHLVERLLPHRERLADTLALALDADALEHLDTAAAALDHLEVHPHAVAGLELGHLAALAVLDVLDHCHGGPSSSSEAVEWYQWLIGVASGRSFVRPVA